MAFEPKLIYQATFEIDSEINKKRERRERIAKDLNTLLAALNTWFKEPVNTTALFEFLNKPKPKDELLKQYIAASKISGVSVKAEKVEDILDIPDYEPILELHTRLNSYTQETPWLEWYDNEEKSFIPALLSVKEKEEIIKKHSIYITNKLDLELFERLDQFQRSHNYLVDIGWPLYQNRNQLQTHLRPFFNWESRNEAHTRLEQMRSFLSINFEAFRNTDIVQNMPWTKF